MQQGSARRDRRRRTRRPRARSHPATHRRRHRDRPVPSSGDRCSTRSPASDRRSRRGGNSASRNPRRHRWPNRRRTRRRSSASRPGSGTCRRGRVGPSPRFRIGSPLALVSRASTVDRRQAGRERRRGPSRTHRCLPSGSPAHPRQTRRHAG